MKEEKEIGDAWGIKGYIIPKDEYARLPIPKISLDKETKRSFIDDFVKSKKIVPSADKYNKLKSWCDM
jgi:hypothetical protein